MMEEHPAGKIATGNSFIESPKKVSNPIGIESQWSLGWQGNTKDIFNKPNSSKGMDILIQALTIITIKVA
jgi:hypothetical protein